MYPNIIFKILCIDAYTVKHEFLKYDYDIRFLKATEQAPLLPIIGTYYLVAYVKDKMVSFMPSYLQASADPFGILTKTTSISFNEGNVFFSHIMHCYEITILAIGNSTELYQLLFKRLSSLASEKNAQYYGILNVIDENLLATARQLNLHVNYMWDRFYINFSNICNFKDFLFTLPTHGRQEIFRQLRKFEKDKKSVVIMEKPPFDNIKEVAELCYQTTKKMAHLIIILGKIL